MNEHDQTTGEPIQPTGPTTPPSWQPPTAGEPAAVEAETAATPTEPIPARAALPAASTADAGPVLEAVSASVTPTTPVERQAGPRPSRARWAIAGLIALVVVALSSAGLFALVGAQNESTVASWTPADPIVYVEVRGDLPGDQRQNLGRFLAHFPGFADQSTLDQKLDETLDRLVSKASDGKHDWSKEIKPWFGGQVGMSYSAFPMMAPGASAASLADLRFLVVATQKDPAAAIAWLKSSGATTKDEPYKDVTLTVFDAKGGATVAATATGGVLLVGDETSVKAAVDRGGKDGLDTSKTFKEAMSSLDGDQLVRTFVDVKAYMAAVQAMFKDLGSGAPTLPATMLDRLPDWLAAGGHVDSDALVGDAAMPIADGTPTVPDAESVIARHVPASTVALVESHDVGMQLTTAFAELRKNPQLAEAFKQIDQSAAMIGGLDKLVGWIDDVGVVVTSDGSIPGGGLVIVPTDEAAANQFATQVKNLIALAGGSSGIQMRDEPYGSGTITTIDFGDLSKLGGGLGAAPTGLLSGHIEISYTVQDGVVVIGVGPAWVKSIVDVKSGSSLADQARYKDAMDRVGAKNAASWYVDLAAVRTLAEPLLTGSGSNYATDVKPYVLPFDILAGATRTSDGKRLIRSVITVTNPK